MSDTAAPVKRTTRKRSSSAVTTATEPTPVSVSVKNVKVISELFSELLSVISDDKISFDTLRKEMLEVRESWAKEQTRHQTELQERDQQEELSRRREREAYDYETARTRKQAEDEFTEKKAKWERELATRKEEIEQERQELELLRKQVDGFEAQLEKAVKETGESVQRELTEQFTTEKKLRDQEVKAEKEILNLRIANLANENARQAKETQELKQALENASRQLKDIAVKVIESSTTSTKTTPVVET